MRTSIVDTFLFNGEVDLLSLRMAELEGIVDRHIALMGDRTHQGGSWDFEAFHAPSVNFVTVPIGRGTPHELEARQREFVSDLGDAAPDVLYLHGDVDEIPRASAVQNAAHAALTGPVRLRGDLHQLCLDWWLPAHQDGPVHPYAGPTLATGREYAARGTTNMRQDLSLPERRHSGWHLQWVMTPAECVRKVETFSHPEFNRPPYNRVEFWETARGQGLDPFARWDLAPADVRTLPKAVRENPEAWAHLMRPRVPA